MLVGPIFVANLADETLICGVLGTLYGVLVTNLLNFMGKTSPNPQYEATDQEEPEITHKSPPKQPAVP